jgi:heme A synthase
MTKTFRVLAFLIAGLVVVQAAVMVWAIAGLGIWISEDGGELTNQVFEDAFEGGDAPFPEFAGLMIHGVNGTMVIPILALILLVVGLIAKFPGSTKYGAAIFLLVILQVALGIFGHSLSIAGGLHGINALILFSVAIMAGVRARDVPVATESDRPTVHA